MNALDIIDQVPELGRLIALEIQKNIHPNKDAIPQNEAFRNYGRAWIEKQLNRGLLNPKFHGSRKMYSKSEIERVKAKENAAARLIMK